MVWVDAAIAAAVAASSRGIIALGGRANDDGLVGGTIREEGATSEAAFENALGDGWVLINWKWFEGLFWTFKRVECAVQAMMLVEKSRSERQKHGARKVQIIARNGTGVAAG